MPEHESCEDLTLLLTQAKDGCRQSTNELFRLFENYLLVISNCELDQRLRSKFGSSDVVQLAFSKAIAALDKFHGTNSKEFKSWLRTILVNEIQQIRRAFSRSSRATDRERRLDGDTADAGFAESMAHPDLTPQSQSLRQEQIDIVRRTVEKLSESDQQVIRLRNWERWTFAQIGEHLDKSEEAVKKSWQRAIKRLDELMRSDESIE